MNNFYVYVYLNTMKPGTYNYDTLNFEFEPFYIGKGKGRRLIAHLNAALKNKYNGHKINTINKIIKTTGQSPIIMKINENLTSEDAFKLEIEYIKLIGRLDLGLGPLLNLTDGGEGGIISKKPGMLGKKHTEKTKRLMSAAKLGIKFSQEHKNNLREARKNRITKKSTIDKMKTSMIGKNKRKYIQIHEFIDKDNNHIITSNGIVAFCDENKLNTVAIRELIKGKRSTYKGYSYIKQINK